MVLYQVRRLRWSDIGIAFFTARSEASAGANRRGEYCPGRGYCDGEEVGQAGRHAWGVCHTRVVAGGGEVGFRAGYYWMLVWISTALNPTYDSTPQVDPIRTIMLLWIHKTRRYPLPTPSKAHFWGCPQSALRSCALYQTGLGLRQPPSNTLWRLTNCPHFWCERQEK